MYVNFSIPPCTHNPYPKIMTKLLSKQLSKLSCLAIGLRVSEALGQSKGYYSMGLISLRNASSTSKCEGILRLLTELLLLFINTCATIELNYGCGQVF